MAEPWKYVKRVKFDDETRYQGLLEAQKREKQPSRPTMHDVIETWMDQANCVGTNPESFFPYLDQFGKSRNLSQERRICAACDVRQQCANYALKINANAGLWAGVLIGSTRLWREHLKMIANGKEPK